jgi:hypothetical protein
VAREQQLVYCLRPEALADVWAYRPTTSRVGIDDG